MADLLAELGGYRAELARYDRLGRTERAAAVRDQIDRLITTVSAEADRLDAVSDNHMSAGQDLQAARATIEARRLRAALADLGVAQPGAAEPEVAELGVPETAADSTPRETAVTTRKGRANA
jgi:hypothetical protein